MNNVMARIVFYYVSTENEKGMYCAIFGSLFPSALGNYEFSAIDFI